VRQLFNWRFVAAVGALAFLALLARGVLVDDDSIATIIEAPVSERQIDLVEPVATITQADGFRIGLDGVTSGFLDLTLDTERIVRVAPGTLGEIACSDLDVPDGCVVFADMLGDAVVWFALLPQAPGATVELPPIVDLQDGDAVFTNGWRLPYAPVIERECGDEDIPTFSDFLRRFGPDSVSIVDLETRQVTAVVCGEPVDD
jgi:hypothetical protein